VWDWLGSVLQLWGGFRDRGPLVVAWIIALAFTGFVGFELATALLAWL
jgi:hypothetical protein